MGVMVRRPVHTPSIITSRRFMLPSLHQVGASRQQKKFSGRARCSLNAVKLRNDRLEAGTQPATELIFGEWYPALRADTLAKGKSTTLLLLGVPLLMGRKNDGSIFAMRDLCPHRGIPLSAGWFDGETVQCRYHGWKFEPCGGQCVEIPS